MLQHLRVRSSHRFHQLDHPFGLRTVVHAKRQVHASKPIAECPVSHLARDELRVGDDDFCTPPGVHRAGASANAPHLTEDIA